MKKYVIPFIVLGIITALILLAWGLNKNRHKAGKEFSEAAELLKGLRTVTARKMMSDYMNDTYKADKTYTKYRTVLTGTILSISRTETENYINQFEYSIRLDGGKVGESQTEVWCFFPRSETSKLQDMKEGDALRISGSVNTDSHYDSYDGKTKYGSLRRRLLGGSLFRKYRPPESESEFVYYVVMDACRRVK